MLIFTLALFTTGCNAKDSEKDVSSTEETNFDSSKDNVLGEGNSKFTFTVIDKDGNESTFEIHTDKKIKTVKTDGLSSFRKSEYSDNESENDKCYSCDSGDLAQLCIKRAGLILAEECFCSAAEHAAQTLVLAGLEQNGSNQHQTYENVSYCKNQS